MDESRLYKGVSKLKLIILFLEKFKKKKFFNEMQFFKWRKTQLIEFFHFIFLDSRRDRSFNLWFVLFSLSYKCFDSMFMSILLSIYLVCILHEKMLLLRLLFRNWNAFLFLNRFNVLNGVFHRMESIRECTKMDPKQFHAIIEMWPVFNDMLEKGPNPLLRYKANRLRVCDHILYFLQK